VPDPPDAGRRGHVQRAHRARRARGLSTTSDRRPSDRDPPDGGLIDSLLPALLDSGQAAALDVHGRVNAAVLVPLYQDQGELHVVLTKRQDHLRRHAGEISFPGGRQDDEDADLRQTALREAHEEIGLPADAVRLLGALQPIPTIATNYAVYPFVGLIEAGRRWVPSTDEVQAVLEFPLARLREGYDRRRLVRRGLPFRTDTFALGEHLIWGATARILADLLERLGPPVRLPTRS
jgi:8-oxo-dGTP pyrophosphatase MutT (NUDIX family)